MITHFTTNRLRVCKYLYSILFVTFMNDNCLNACILGNDVGACEVWGVTLTSDFVDVVGVMVMWCLRRSRLTLSHYCLFTGHH